MAKKRMTAAEEWLDGLGELRPGQRLPEPPRGLRAILDGALNEALGHRGLWVARLDDSLILLPSESADPHCRELVRGALDNDDATSALALADYVTDEFGCEACPELRLWAASRRSEVREQKQREVIRRAEELYLAQLAADPASRLNCLPAEIATQHQAVLVGMRTTLEAARAAGDLLIEAKQLVRHSNFLRWLESAALPFSERTAQDYMSLARNWGALVANPQFNADLGLNGALRLLRPGRHVEPGDPEDPLRFDDRPDPSAVAELLAAVKGKKADELRQSHSRTVEDAAQAEAEVDRLSTEMREEAERRWEEQQRESQAECEREAAEREREAAERERTFDPDAQADNLRMALEALRQRWPEAARQHFARVIQAALDAIARDGD